MAEKISKNGMKKGERVMLAHIDKECTLSFVNVYQTQCFQFDVEPVSIKSKQEKLSNAPVRYMKGSENYCHTEIITIVVETCESTGNGWGIGGDGGYPDISGGGGGNLTNYSPISPAPKEIIDSLKGYPCAQELLRILPNLKSEIASLISETFKKSDLADIVFGVEPKLAGTTVDGKHASFSGGGNYSVQQIGLNPDVLNKSSKEYILATMYHEALHTFFAKEEQRLGTVEFAKKYTGVELFGGRLLGIQGEDHVPVGYIKYINQLKEAILAFNPNLGDIRAGVLAKAGIIKLSLSEKTINDQERDTTDPVKNPGYQGTKCP